MGVISFFSVCTTFYLTLPCHRVFPSSIFFVLISGISFPFLVLDAACFMYGISWVTWYRVGLIGFFSLLFFFLLAFTGALVIFLHILAGSGYDVVLRTW